MSKRLGKTRRAWLGPNTSRSTGVEQPRRAPLGPLGLLSRKEVWVESLDRGIYYALVRPYGTASGVIAQTRPGGQGAVNEPAGHRPQGDLPDFSPSRDLSADGAQRPPVARERATSAVERRRAGGASGAPGRRKCAMESAVERSESGGEEANQRRLPRTPHAGMMMMMMMGDR